MSTPFRNLTSFFSSVVPFLSSVLTENSVSLIVDVFVPPYLIVRLKILSWISSDLIYLKYYSHLFLLYHSYLCNGLQSSVSKLPFFIHTEVFPFPPRLLLRV